METLATSSEEQHLQVPLVRTRQERLSSIVSLWERQLRQIEDSAYIHFRDQNLPKISELIMKKRALERRLTQLRGFMAHCEE
ncbi:MAG: hypothetical protein OWT28_01735 [Firmicutes bacterium]|nr:hypothetical protein [Bacillota bacterium]